MSYNIQLSVTVRGKNLWAPQFMFVRVENSREIPYTPLGGSAESPSFILTDNGTYRIYCNGYLYRTITIEDAVLPTKKTTNVAGKLEKEKVQNPTGGAYYEITTERCLNYARQISETYPYIHATFFRGSGVTLLPSDFELINAVNENYYVAGQQNHFIVSPIDDSLPVVIYLYGYIAFVGNYEQQRRRRR